MDWAEILNALGGGPGAVMLVGLVWFCRHLMVKVDALTAMLMDRNEDKIRQHERERLAILQALEAVTDIIKEYARSK